MTSGSAGLGSEGRQSSPTIDYGGYLIVTKRENFTYELLEIWIIFNEENHTHHIDR